MGTYAYRLIPDGYLMYSNTIQGHVHFVHLATQINDHRSSGSKGFGRRTGLTMSTNTVLTKSILKSILQRSGLDTASLSMLHGFDKPSKLTVRNGKHAAARCGVRRGSGQLMIVYMTSIRDGRTFCRWNSHFSTNVSPLGHQM